MNNRWSDAIGSTNGLQIDDGIGHDPRHGELSGSVSDHTILQLKASCARGLGRPVAIHPAQPNAQPLDLAPAVVDQMQPRLPGIAREPPETPMDTPPKEQLCATEDAQDKSGRIWNSEF